MSLLSAALLDPAELSERQLSGDGGGQRKLVVGTSSSLQFQTWEKKNDHVRHQLDCIVKSSASICQDLFYLCF